MNAKSERGRSRALFDRTIQRGRPTLISVPPGYEMEIPESVVGKVTERYKNGGNGPVFLVLRGYEEGATTSHNGRCWTTSPAYIIDLIRRGHMDLLRLAHVVVQAPSEQRLAYLADVGFILAKTDRSPNVIVVCEEELSSEELERLPNRRWRRIELRGRVAATKEGSTDMAGRSDGYIDNPEALASQLREIIRRIHDEADPHEMNAYKKFVKRHVSVFSRSYFTAYLVKQFVEGNTSVVEGTARTEKRSRSRRPEREAKAKREEETGGNVAQENRQTLFVSVGKNRRVYPKDFIALFAELDGVTTEDIGQIKILDNYSFVDVEQSIADKIITAYDGYEFRGRKLTVNIARAKKE